MSDTSENLSAVAASRRTLRHERQARVGILRNPNAPPRPAPRKAELMGKWPRLRSGRRPPAGVDVAKDVSQPRGCERTGKAPVLNDAELARLMRQADDIGRQPSFSPPRAPATTGPAPTRADTAQPHLPRRGPGAAPVTGALVLLGGLGFLFAVAHLAAAP